MSKIVQKALEEAIELRDTMIDQQKCTISHLRNELYAAIVFINDKCQGVPGQNEMYERLNKAHSETKL